MPILSQLRSRSHRCSFASAKRVPRGRYRNIARSTSSCPQACHSQHCAAARSTSTAYCRACGPTTFLIAPPEADNVQRTLGRRLLQLADLFLQLPQPLRLAHFQSAALRLPAVKRLFADTALAAQLSRRKAPSNSFKIPTICSSVYGSSSSEVLLLKASSPRFIRELSLPLG